MSLSLGTVSSPVVNGRCVDCGQFIARDTSHFHGPKRKFRGRPVAHLYNWGEGGIVTRCDDPVEARRLLIAKYRREGMEDEMGDAELVFPEGKGEIQRGRVNVNGSGDEYAWWWMRLDDNAKGPGVTTAVVWSP